MTKTERAWQPTQHTAELLRVGREQLVERTLLRNHDLFRALYNLDRSPAQRALIFEREAVMWIDSHGDLIDRITGRSSTDEPLDEIALATERLALRAYAALLNCMLGDEAPVPRTTLATRILVQRRLLLDRLIQFAEQDQADYEDLLTARARDNALYRRALREAERGAGSDDANP